MAMTKVMVGFKANQCNSLVLVGQVKQMLDFGFLLWQKFGFVCLEQGFVGNAFAKSLAHGGWNPKFGDVDVRCVILKGVAF